LEKTEVSRSRPIPRPGESACVPRLPNNVRIIIIADSNHVPSGEAQLPLHSFADRFWQYGSFSYSEAMNANDVWTAETMIKKSNRAEGADFGLHLIEWQRAYQAHMIAHPDASVEECERAGNGNPLAWDHVSRTRSVDEGPLEAQAG
jgi:hypothetical protein